MWSRFGNHNCICLKISTKISIIKKGYQIVPAFIVGKITTSRIYASFSISIQNFIFNLLTRKQRLWCGFWWVALDLPLFLSQIWPRKIWHFKTVSHIYLNLLWFSKVWKINIYLARGLTLAFESKNIKD